MVNSRLRFFNVEVVNLRSGKHAVVRNYQVNLMLRKSNEVAHKFRIKINIFPETFLEQTTSIIEMVKLMFLIAFFIKLNST